MDTRLIDVFVSYSRADAVRVEPWIKLLRKGGIVVWFDSLHETGTGARRLSAREAAKRCEVLVFFISKSVIISREMGEMAAQASSGGKAVIIVTLDMVPVPAVFDLQQPRVTVVELLAVGRQAAWEALLKGVRDQGIPWIAPGTKRRRSSRPNQRRSTAMARAWLRWAVLAMTVLVGGSLAVTHFKPAASGPPAALPSAAPAAPSGSAAGQLLTVTAGTAPPAPAGAGGSSTSGPPPITLPPRPTLPTQEEAMDPKTARAVEHVKSCIEAANRENGLTQEQIDKIATYWADPVEIEGRGPQSQALIKASAFNRQKEFPRFRETIHHIKAVGTEKPAELEVIVQTSYAAENPATQVRLNGVVLSHYVVDVADMNAPKIVKLWSEHQQSL